MHWLIKEDENSKWVFDKLELDDVITKEMFCLTSSWEDINFGMYRPTTRHTLTSVKHGTITRLEGTISNSPGKYGDGRTEECGYRNKRGDLWITQYDVFEFLDKGNKTLQDAIDYIKEDSYYIDSLWDKGS
jgi:hypothetical protein